MANTARETQLVDYSTTYRTHAYRAAAAMACVAEECDGDHEHDGDELALANTEALLAGAAAAMFQGLAALEAADRTAR